jgi:hypothetical protein
MGLVCLVVVCHGRLRLVTQTQCYCRTVAQVRRRRRLLVQRTFWESRAVVLDDVGKGRMLKYYLKETRI